jgi:hypothetical protein
LIDIFSNSILYRKFKVNNKNDMAAHAFWACFVPADGGAKLAQQLKMKLRVILSFHLS